MNIKMPKYHFCIEKNQLSSNKCWKELNDSTCSILEKVQFEGELQVRRRIKIFSCIALSKKRICIF